MIDRLIIVLECLFQCYRHCITYVIDTYVPCGEQSVPALVHARSVDHLPMHAVIYIYVD